jgi:hypothetical protein
MLGGAADLTGVSFRLTDHHKLSSVECRQQHPGEEQRKPNFVA